MGALLGQTLFSLALIRAFRPRSAKSVALCTVDIQSFAHCLRTIQIWRWS